MERVYLVDLEQHIGELRNIGIAFEQGRENPEVLVCGLKQLPHRVDDIGAVGVDNQVRRLHQMAGHMGVGNAFTRKLTQKDLGVVTVIDTVDVNIIDIEQQQAIGAVENTIDKLVLFDFLIG